MLNTILFQIDLIRFRKYLSVCMQFVSVSQTDITKHPANELPELFNLSVLLTTLTISNGHSYKTLSGDSVAHSRGKREMYKIIISLYFLKSSNVLIY